MKKRLLASLTALCLLVGLFPTAAMAADPGDSEGVVSGSGTQLDPWVISADGEDNNVKAYLEETGNVINAIYGEAIKLSAGQSYVLHIFGEGAMKDFTITNAGADGTPATDTRPWAEKADQIVEIVMEENVTSIGDRAFQNLTELTTANIPASITDLGDHIFQGDISLTTVEWASGFTAPSITDTDSNHETYTGAYVPTSMFDGCTSLGESLELNEWLPSSFTGVGCAAFRGTAFSVDFDSWDNLAYIGTYGFASMPNLESITITEKYTFGLRGTNETYGAFQGSGLTSVTIQSGLKSILRSMFDGCESLSSFTLSNDVKTIKSYALRGTTALKSIDLNCVETIDTYAFDGSGLETLTLPQGTTKVDSRAFRNCADLDTLTINSSDVDIESMAFAGCTSLESVTTGASTDVTFNNAFAADGDSFGACTSVTELIAEGKLAGNITALTSLKRLSMDSESAILNAPATFPAVDTLIVTGDSWQVKNYAFANTNKMGDLVVSVGSVTSAENANSGFRKNTSLESVQFTGSAVTLQQDMFNACSNLNWIDLSQVDNLTFGNKCFGSSSTSGWEGQFNSNCVIYVADGTDGTAARTNTGLTDSTGIVLITNGGTVDVEQAEPGFAAVTKDNAAAQWYEYNAEEENGYSGEQVTTPEAGKTYIAIWDEDTDVEVTTTEEEDSSDPADASTSEETSSTVPVQPADPTAEELADDETAKKEPAKEDPPSVEEKETTDEQAQAEENVLGISLTHMAPGDTVYSFYANDKLLGTTTNGETTLSYDTTKKGLNIGANEVTVYEGNDNTGTKVGTITVNLKQKPVTVTLTGDDAGWYTAIASTVTVDIYETSGSSGSSDSDPSYSPILDVSDGGEIKVSPRTPEEDEEVTITVDPDAGYELDELTVTDRNGREIDVTANRDGTYTFIQPRGRVTIEANFVRTGESGFYFIDVPESAYYYDAVYWAVDEGITNGTTATTFSPNNACTRAQMVTFLWRAAGEPEPETTVNPFTDVAAGAYYYDAVLWAVEQGITNGTTATTFSPDATVTRAQTVTFLWRSAGSPAATGSSFADVASDAYYAGAVAWAVSEGITNGTTATTFSPGSSCTRAQIVTFLYRYLG